MMQTAKLTKTRTITKKAGTPGNTLELPLDTAPMEARTAEALPDDGAWQFEPKWDGFRCLAFKAGAAVELRAKSGKPLGRYFPEVVALLRDLRFDRFVVDGELVIEIDRRLSFDSLQMRLHPAASRIWKLSVETPARLVLFDMLAAPDGKRLMELSLKRRRSALDAFGKKAAVPGQLIISPYTRDREQAKRWLMDFGRGATEPGKRAMIKVKRLRTADCVVGGFRYESKSREVGSLLLGLYDTDDERPALTRSLETLREPPGFSGKAPGDPSRWSTERSGEWEPLRPELVVEVRFDHVTGDRFRHGTKLLRWRLDKATRQCTFEQLELPIADVAGLDA